MEMLERILSKENMALAYKRVMRNQGSGGVDGMEVPELLSYLIRHWESVKLSILEEKYRPQPVKGVEIDKPKGGKRLLGIPTVLDRLIQQAIQQVSQRNV